MYQNLKLNITLNFKVWSNWHSPTLVWHKLSSSVVQPANATRLQENPQCFHELPSPFMDNGFLLQKARKFTIFYFWISGQFDE